MSDTIRTKKIRLSLDGPLAWVTLDRPDKLNALDREMLEGLETASTLIDRNDRVRVALLTGAGDRAFCVGADINAWSELEPLDMWRRWTRDGQRLFDCIAQLRVPVIAVLNGYAFGGGLELALSADLRIAADDAALALPEATIGTVPGWAGTRRLPRLIGPARAKEMIFSGERVDARKAERWGLVNEVVPRARLMHKAAEIADRIAENAPIPVQIAKQLVNTAVGEAQPSTIESVAGGLAAMTDDAQEGLVAFRERRPPRFSGR
ncbi:MAG: enoyl-CoA hydratase-related protein [Rhodothermales bacterium]